MSFRTPQLVLIVASFFQTIDGVKSHVVQGRCQYYDPRATAETLEVEPRWQQACLDGQLHCVAKSHGQNATHCSVPNVWQGLQTGCRPRWFAGHLQGAHSRLWRQAWRLTHVLVALIYEYGQCCCQSDTKCQACCTRLCTPCDSWPCVFTDSELNPLPP